MMRWFVALATWFILAAVVAPDESVLDAMDDVTLWSAQGSDSVTATSSVVAGANGGAVQLRYDFEDVSGYAFLRRPFALGLPRNFELRFHVRGIGGRNDLQLKLTQGDTVWWRTWRNFAAPEQWAEIRIPAGDISFAWGPDATVRLAQIDGIEFVVARNRDGGAGVIEIDDLRLIELPGEPVVSVTEDVLVNDAIATLARSTPRGTYPRAFMGEQPYWTMSGSDGGQVTALISEDAAIEPAKGSFSIEPMLIEGAHRYDWSNVVAAQSLTDGYLPIPTVRWVANGLQLDTTLLVDPNGEGQRAVYRMTNQSSQARRFTLALALRSLQVNPPAQFLSQRGGFSPIDAIIRDADAWVVSAPASDDSPPRQWRVTPDHAPDAVGGGDMRAVGALAPRGTDAARSTNGYATATLYYDWHLAPGQSRMVSLAIPHQLDARVANATQLDTSVRQHWRDVLNRMTIEVPPQHQAFANTLRTSMAHILMSRDGPMLKPGTRSYDRAWIRDGAMMSEALLRLGRADVARGFADWYRGHLFANGKVPCCVDFRGADPVPENDSQGEYIFLVAELYRYTGDHAALERDWPSVLGAVRHMDRLRLSERTAANGSPDRRMLYGLMPPSISHEGYSAKAQYSLWDDFWALRGYRDAADIAAWLDAPEAAEIATSRDQFSDDLHRAIRESARHWGINHIPGATSLGDFDATSTTIALDPGGEQSRLDPMMLEATFERYWAEFLARRDGGREWDAYTPYEWRTVSSFTRLGWRTRVQQSLAYFMADRRPQPWNQWAEVVGRDPREVRFIGDMPHAWVASDFIRSALDMFSYERHEDHALVLGAGLTVDWMTGRGSRLSGLQTPYGRLDFSIRGDANRLIVDIGGSARPPGGFVIPWPFESAPPRVLVNGRFAQWNDRTLVVPARGRPLRIEIGQ